MRIETRALFILFTIPVMWGITFPLIHKIVATYSPALFVVWRFLLAALILLPAFIGACSRRELSAGDVRYGLIIGVINSGAFLLQAIALQWLGSSRTAFLSGLNVIMVPLLLPFFNLGRPKKVDLVAALFCLLGIYLISDADLRNFHFGDLMVVLSALCIALGIIVTEKASLVSNNLRLLTFYQIVFTNLIPVGWLQQRLFIFPHDSFFWVSAVYCAVLATALPLFLQLKYQKFVGSSKVAIIFSLESVTATFFAWLAGEHITLHVIIGGIVILASSIYSDIHTMLFGERSAFIRRPRTSPIVN